MKQDEEEVEVRGGWKTRAEDKLISHTYIYSSPPSPLSLALPLSLSLTLALSLSLSLSCTPHANAHKSCFYLFLPVIHSPSGTVWTIRWISSICESILGKRIVWNTAKSGWTTECLKEQNSLKRTEKGQMEDLSSIFEHKT